MARLTLFLHLLLLSIFCISATAETALARRSRATAYIEASCKITRYPALCIQCLSTFAKNSSTTPSSQQLAQAALSISLYKAKYTRSYMLKVVKELAAKKATEYQAVKDCLEQINDSVNQISQSIRELRRLGTSQEAASDAIFWHVNNVETWLSSAQTDASACVDEFPGRNMSKLKATIKGKVLNVAQTASNALVLFHRYAARYKVAAKTKVKP